MSFLTDPFKIAKFLGIPLPPKPLLYAMLVVVVLLPIAILYYTLRTGSILPRYVPVLSIVVLLIYAYFGYLAWKATHLSIGRELDGSDLSNEVAA